MPTIRYQIRNEYGLADPELYREADKDDPEALLEGVAMAGLIGVLRQLGDLAQFAAEIFHDLHEEVMATAARGHGLMLRVEQLESEFPSIEKAFLSQTSPSRFAYNAGIDWHADLQVDQNLVTRGDMPRFILDSYEECRGPPRFFMLDKFDVAGAGACLKRYSDPSFFKMDLASLGKMEPEVQRENKARKIKKKGSRWRNGETAESFLAPHIDSNLQSVTSGKVPTRRVKLKTRNLTDSDITSRRSYMEHLLEAHTPEQKILLKNSISHSHSIARSIDSSQSAPQVREILVDNTSKSPIFRERNLTEYPTKQEAAYLPINVLENQKREGEEIMERLPELSGEVQKSYPTSHIVEKKIKSAKSETKKKVFVDGYRSDEAEKSPPALQEDDHKKYLPNAEFITEGGIDGYRSDGIGSELDNYIDALNTMESEIETDSENRAKSDPGFFNMEPHQIDSGINEPQQEMPAQFSEPDYVENSTASLGLNNVLKSGISSFSTSDTLGNMADARPPQENMSGSDVSANPKVCLGETHDKSSEELQGNAGVTELISLVHFLSNETCNAQETDITIFKSETEEASSGSCVRNSNYSPIHVHSQGSCDKAQSINIHQNQTFSGYVEDTREVAQELDGNLPCTAETSELPSQENDMEEELSKSDNNSDIFSDGLLNLSDMGSSPGEYAEEQIEATLDIPDHLFETKDEGILEEAPTLHVEGSSPTLIVDIEGELQKSMEQETETCSGGSTSPKGELQKSMEQETEVCSGGSTSSKTPAFPPVVSSTVVQPEGFAADMENVVQSEVLAAEISSDYVIDTHEVAGYLDGEFPCTVETSSQENDYAAFLKATENSGISSDVLLIISDIPEKSHSEEDAEMLFSDNMANTQGESIPEVVLSEHVEDSLASFTVHAGDSQEPLEQDTVETSEFPYQENDDTAFLRPAGNSGISSDVFLTVSDIPDNPHSKGDAENLFSENMATTQGKSIPEEVPTEYVEDSLASFTLHVEDSHESIEQDTEACSGEDISQANSDLPPEISPMIMQPDGAAVEMENVVAPGEDLADSQSVVGNAYDIGEREILMPNIVPPGLEHLVDAEPQESHNVESVELVPFFSGNEIFPEDMQLQSNKSDWVVIDGPEAVSDNLEFLSNLHKDATQFEQLTQCDDSLAENVIVEADVGNHAPFLNSSEASGFVLELREDYVSSDAVLDQHKLEINEVCSPDNTTSLHSESNLCISLPPQNEDQPVSSSPVSRSELTILESLDSSDGIGHMMPSEHAKRDLCSNIYEENPIYSSESEDSSSGERMSPPSTHLLVEPAIPLEESYKSKTGNAPNVVSSHQEGDHLEPSEVQFERAYFDEQNNIQSKSEDLDDKPSDPVAEPDNGKMNESDTPLSTHLVVEPAIPLEEASKSKTGNEPNVVSSHQEGDHLEQSDLQFERAYSDGQKNIQSTSEDLDDKSSEAGPKPDNGKISGSDKPPNTAAALPLIASSDLAISETSPQESSEQQLGESISCFQLQDVEETAPPPPLPPLQWRMGKLRLGSLTPGGNAVQLPMQMNPFMPLSDLDEKHPQGSATDGCEMVQPANPFAPLPVLEDERFHHDSLAMEGEISRALKLSDLPPILEGEKYQHGTLFLEGEMGNPSKPFLGVSPIEDDKHSCGREAPVPPLENETSQHPHLLPEEKVQAIPDRRPQLGQLLPSLELERSQHESLVIERDPLPSLNPFLVASSTEEWKYQYGYGVYGGESVQHLNLSAPLPITGAPIPHYGFMYSMGENPSTLYDIMVPTMEAEKPNWKHRFIRDRPRDPLIEAVAAHDKSTLRKVSELDRPSARPPAEERDTLLEQIRNKSFNLKPAGVMKPNTKGPPTNLKVAAILEKANAIRQAFVGSDEDDDDADCWSDS